MPYDESGRWYYEPKKEPGFASSAINNAWIGLKNVGSGLLTGIGASMGGIQEKVYGRDVPQSQVSDWAGLADWFRRSGQAIRESSQKDTQQYGVRDEYRNLDVLDRLTNWKYLSDPRGATADIFQGVGSSIPFIAASAAAGGTPILGTALRGVSSLPSMAVRGVASTAGNNLLGRGITAAMDKGLDSMMRAGLQYGMTTAPLDAFVNSSEIVDRLKKQGYSDEAIYDRMSSMMSEEIPYNVMFNAPLGATLFGKWGSALSRGKRVGASAANIPLDMVAEYHQEGNQERLARKYANEPYSPSVWSMKYPEELEAARAGAMGAIGMGTAGLVRSALPAADNATQNPPSPTPQAEQKPPQTPPTDSLPPMPYSQDYPKDLRDWTRKATDKQMNDEVHETIVETARAFGVDPRLALSVAMVESNGRQDAVSEAGARGVMQLMPETASDLGVNADNQTENIYGGIKYIKQMLDRYNGDRKLAMAAYNAGPGNVDRAGGIPDNGQTPEYVAKIEAMMESSPIDEGDAEQKPIYTGEKGGAEGRYWIRQNERVSYDGAKPETMDAIDILGQWFYRKTGRPLVITAVTNGRHADGERSHGSGWKADVNDWGSGGAEGAITTDNGGKGYLADEFMKFGQSIGLGMNWEGDHIDVSASGHQWADENGNVLDEPINYGGLNTEALGKESVRPKSALPEETAAVEEEPNAEQSERDTQFDKYIKKLIDDKGLEPTFEIGDYNPLTNQIVADFLNEKKTELTGEEELEYAKFLSGKLNEETGRFSNTKANREAVQERFGSELQEYGQQRLNEMVAAYSEGKKKPESSQSSKKEVSKYLPQLGERLSSEMSRRSISMAPQELDALKSGDISAIDAALTKLKAARGVNWMEIYLNPGKFASEAMNVAGTFKGLNRDMANRFAFMSNGMLQDAVDRSAMQSAAEMDAGLMPGLGQAQSSQQSEPPTEQSQSQSEMSSVLSNEQTQSDEKPSVDVSALKNEIGKMQVQLSREQSNMNAMLEGGAEGEFIRASAQKIKELQEAIESQQTMLKETQEQRQAQASKLFLNRQSETPNAATDEEKSPAISSAPNKSSMPRNSLRDETEPPPVTSKSESARNGLMDGLQMSLPTNDVTPQEISKTELARNELIMPSMSLPELPWLSNMRRKKLEEAVSVGDEEEARRAALALLESNQEMKMPPSSRAPQMSIPISNGLLDAEKFQAMVDSNPLQEANDARNQMPNVAMAMPTISQMNVNVVDDARAQEKQSEIKKPRQSAPVMQLRVAAEANSKDEQKVLSQELKAQAAELGVTLPKGVSKSLNEGGNEKSIKAAQDAIRRSGRQVLPMDMSDVRRSILEQLYTGITDESERHGTSAEHRRATAEELEQTKDQALNKHYARAEVRAFPALKPLVDEAVKAVREKSADWEGKKQALETLEQMRSDQRGALALEVMYNDWNNREERPERSELVNRVMDVIKDGMLGGDGLYDGLYNAMYGDDAAAQTAVEELEERNERMKQSYTSHRQANEGVSAEGDERVNLWQLLKQAQGRGNAMEKPAVRFDGRDYTLETGLDDNKKSDRAKLKRLQEADGAEYVGGGRIKYRSASEAQRAATVISTAETSDKKLKKDYRQLNVREYPVLKQLADATRDAEAKQSPPTEKLKSELELMKRRKPEQRGRFATGLLITKWLEEKEGRELSPAVQSALGKLQDADLKQIRNVYDEVFDELYGGKEDSETLKRANAVIADEQLEPEVKRLYDEWAQENREQLKSNDAKAMGIAEAGANILGWLEDRRINGRMAHEMMQLRLDGRDESLTRYNELVEGMYASEDAKREYGIGTKDAQKINEELYTKGQVSEYPVMKEVIDRALEEIRTGSAQTQDAAEELKRIGTAREEEIPYLAGDYLIERWSEGREETRETRAKLEQALNVFAQRNEGALTPAEAYSQAAKTLEYEGRDELANSDWKANAELAYRNVINRVAEEEKPRRRELKEPEQSIFGTIEDADRKLHELIPPVKKASASATSTREEMRRTRSG